MISFPEMMFYAEEEGLLPTRRGKLNAIIRDVIEFPTPTIDLFTFKQIILNNGLTFESLSDAELAYINAGIEK